MPVRTLPRIANALVSNSDPRRPLRQVSPFFVRFMFFLGALGDGACSVGTVLCHSSLRAVVVGAILVGPR